MITKRARFGACQFRNSYIYVFCGVCHQDESDNKSTFVRELNSIEKYDISSDTWLEMTINSKENLLPCHNLGTFNCFGIHCKEEGMIIFAGEYNTA